MRPERIRQERPLHASWEARTTAPAQARSLHFVNHLRWLHGRDGLLQAFKAAILLINIDFVKIGNIPVTQQDVSHYLPSPPPFLSDSMNSTVFSTVMFS